MRSDNDIRSDVLAGLNWSSSVRDEDIAVAVKGGVVTLAGTVDSYAQRYSAECCVEAVGGVRGIANDLVVKQPGLLVRSDSEIAHAAVEALARIAQVPDDLIRVRVTNAWVTIEGEVGLPFQKEAAEHAVRPLTGIKGVSNLITLRATVRASTTRV